MVYIYIYIYIIESSVNSEEEKERNKYKKVVLLRDAQPDMSSVEDVLGPKKVVEVSQPRLEAGICKNFKPTQVKTKYLPTEFPPSFFDMEELDDDNLHSQMQPNSPLNKLLSPSGTPVPHSPDSPRSAPLKRPKPQILAMKEDFRKLQEYEYIYIYIYYIDQILLDYQVKRLVKIEQELIVIVDDFLGKLVLQAKIFMNCMKMNNIKRNVKNGK